MERRRYQTEVEERKKNLDKLTLDVSTIETSLEKTGYIYRELHDQRQILVKHWEEAVKATISNFIILHTKKMTFFFPKEYL